MTQEQLVAILTPYLVTIITVVLTSLAAYVVSLVKHLAMDASIYLQTKVSASDYNLLRTIAKDMVMTLDQMPAYKELLGAEKKQIAVTKITQYADRAGMPFTASEISEVIEAVLAEVSKDMTGTLIEVHPSSAVVPNPVAA